MTGDDLDVITPPTMRVPFRGELLEIGPLRLEQLSAFITASRPIIGRVAIAAGLLKEGEVLRTGAVILDLLEQDAGTFAKALAVVTGRDESFIAGAFMDEVCALVEAVVVLNEDFFSRRLPDLLAMARPIAAKAPPQAHQVHPPSPTSGDGSPASSSSSPEGTGEPKS